MFSLGNPPRRLALVASMAALVLTATISAPASAEIPEGATFVDGADLDVALVAGQTFTVDLDIINGGEESARFTISVMNLQAPAPDAVPFAPAPDASGVIGGLSPIIAGGSVWQQSATMTAEVPAGVYSGQFVVTGSDGTLDQRGFRLTVDPSLGSFGGATSKGLAEPMPGITLAIERSSWILNQSKPAPDVFFPVDPALAPRILPAQLINATGERADLSIGSNGYVTITAHGAGAYKGVLARTGGVGETGPKALADITLNVRDDWWAALILLVIGLVAGLRLEWFATDSVPKASLRVRLARLRDAAERATAGHEAWMESYRQWPGQPGTPRITGESGNRRDTDGAITEVMPYLVDASNRALKDFDALGSLDSRTKRWAADGEEYRKVADAETTFEGMLRSRVALALAWRAFLAEMAEAQKSRDREPRLEELAGTSDTRRAVREALSADIIATADELQQRTHLVDEVLATVGTLQDLAGSLWTIQYWLPDTSAHAEALDELWTQLAGMPNPATDVQLLRRAARVLLDEVIVERRGLRADTLAPSGEDAMLGAIEIAGRRPTATPTDVASIAETPADARRNQWWVNVRYGLLIVAVALVAGLATQYYTNATFGSTGDYLGILVWGFGGVAAGGVLKNLGGVASLLGRAR